MTNKIATKAFTTLPEDNFGVYVENETDKKKLLWLVNQIGEEKLRKSAAKRNKHYPEQLLFVTTILKRFNLKVPPAIYTAVKTPIYRVYILVLKDHSAIKIGITGDWPNRAHAFVKTANYLKNFDEKLTSLFDAMLSMAFPTQSQIIALQIEQQIKTEFMAFRVASLYERGLINYGCGGHKEWFDFSIYELLLQRLSLLGRSFTLHDSLSWKNQ